MVNTIINSNQEKSSATILLSGHDYFDYLTPCIYGWRRLEEWLYIGSSTFGLRRVLTPHHAINKVEPVLLIDKIYIWQFPDIAWDKLAQIENELIYALKPKHNKETCEKEKKITKKEVEILLRQTKKDEIKREVEELLNFDKEIKKPENFPIEIPKERPIFGSYIKVKNLPESFPITKGTLYNWSADKKYKNLFLLADKSLYIDIQVFEMLVKTGKVKL